MKPNPVYWFEIYVQDMERAKSFYEKVFQTTLENLDDTESEMWGFPMEMNAAGASGALIKIDGVPSGGSGTLIYFNCDDVEVELGRVVEAGGKVHKPKTSIGQYGYIGLVVDTEGNTIGLHTPPKEM